MPGMNGIEFIEKAKSLGLDKTLYFILSGGTTPDQQNRIIEVGGSDVLNKPLTVTKIKSLLKQYNF